MTDRYDTLAYWLRQSIVAEDIRRQRIYYKALMDIQIRVMRLQIGWGFQRFAGTLGKQLLPAVRKATRAFVEVGRAFNA